MKTKTIILISAILAVPTFITMLMNLMIAGVHLAGLPPEKSFFTGHWNNLPILWFQIAGILGMVFYFFTLTIYARHRKNIDKMEQALEERYRLNEELSQLRRKYIDKFEKEKVTN
jgi:glycerol-3-phosphate acyltransferase PlsY